MDSKDIFNLQEAYLEIYTEEFKELDDYKTELVKGRHAQLASDILKNRDEVRRLSKKRFAKYRPGIKRKMRELVSQSKHKHKLAQNASDALIRTSVSKSAKISKKIEDLKKEMPGNKIVKFNREEVDYLISYLINEGYANSYESAENIFEHMSIEWTQKILNEGNLSKTSPNQRSLRSIVGPGVPDSPYQRTTSISNLAAQQKRREADMRSAQQLRNTSYSGRLSAGVQSILPIYRGRRVRTNPDYQGPGDLSAPGRMSGTVDRMPGTAPSSTPFASRYNARTSGSGVRTPAQRTYGKNLGYT